MENFIIIMIFLAGLDALVSTQGQAATGKCRSSITEITRQKVIDDALATMNQCDSLLDCGKFIKLYHIILYYVSQPDSIFLHCSFFTKT